MTAQPKSLDVRLRALLARAEAAEAERDAVLADAARLRSQLTDSGKALRWAITYGRNFDHLPHCERKAQRHPAGYICTCGHDAQAVSLEQACVGVVAALREGGASIGPEGLK